MCVCVCARARARACVRLMTVNVCLCLRRRACVPVSDECAHVCALGKTHTHTKTKQKKQNKKKHQKKHKKQNTGVSSSKAIQTSKQMQMYKSTKMEAKQMKGAVCSCTCAHKLLPYYTRARARAIMPCLIYSTWSASFTASVIRRKKLDFRSLHKNSGFQ